MIRVENLSKSFGENLVLDNINLNAREGSILGLVGPNGVGKTTLIKIIMGILLPDQGRILVDNVDVHHNAVIKSIVGYVADQQSFYPEFKVKDMVRLYRETFAMSWNEQRFKELHDIFRLPEERKIKNLSKGMSMQLSILLNLSAQPRLLVMDEPTAGLDPVLRRQVLNILMDIVAENGTTIFVSTHSLHELERICDHIGILYDGRIVFDESLEDMKQKVRKIQVAIENELPEEFLSGEAILRVERQGRVYNIVVKENVDEIMAELQKFNPLLLETVDMSLEEIFIHRMGGMGYGFEQITAK
ncbi:MAG TPA: ABC transporter ATP-binding protein [Clostridia bacterium]|nr:ABC transporter ATP-binding protein [Clostridia bacterium]